MMNRYLSILNRAEKLGWCVKPYCTTCGAQQFRDALNSFGGDNNHQLAQALATLDLDDLMQHRSWHNGLRLALDEIRDPLVMDSILTSWLPHLRHHIPVADLVLFYFVRRGALFAPMSEEILKRWIGVCTSIAIRTRNESLLESLVYVLGSKVAAVSELSKVIAAESLTSDKIALALERGGVSL